MSGLGRKLLADAALMRLLSCTVRCLFLRADIEWEHLETYRYSEEDDAFKSKFSNRDWRNLVPLLCGFSQLEDLTLCSSCHHQALPACITRLSQLHTLDLTLVTSETPIAFPSELSRMTQLTCLGISPPPAHGQWALLSSLQDLSLDHCGAVGLAAIAPHLGRLTSLFVDGGCPKSVEAWGSLQGLPRLQVLKLQAVDLPEDGWVQLGTLRQLTSLSVDRGGGPPPALHHLTGLRSLSLCRVYSASFGQWHLPANLSSLTTLSLVHVRMRSLTVAHGLASLAHLDLSDNILDELPSDISSLSGLTFLSLEGQTKNSSRRFQLAQPLPIHALRNLKTLRLGQSQGEAHWSQQSQAFLREARAMLPQCIIQHTFKKKKRYIWANWS